MSTIAVSSSGTTDLRRERMIAPWWHLTLLVALFVTLTAAGVIFQRRAAESTAAPGHASQIPLYGSLIVMEWGLVLFVVRSGLRRGPMTLRRLIGGRWSRPRDLVIDLVLGLGLWAAWGGIATLWGWWAGPSRSGVERLLPESLLEALFWIALSLSAGFCEEVVFRGYLMRQLEALTRSRWVAVILQAILFGISHGYQGAQACTRIAVFGALFGCLALWRSSLRPGMIAHAWTDIVAGLVRS